MPFYQVKLERNTTEVATITIEATTQARAEIKAKIYADNGVDMRWMTRFVPKDVKVTDACRVQETPHE